MPYTYSNNVANDVFGDVISQHVTSSVNVHDTGDTYTMTVWDVDEPLPDGYDYFLTPGEDVDMFSNYQFL